MSHANMEPYLQLELWRGNVAGAVQIAREANQISDWVVAMAPLASYDLWEVVSAEYAEQLEEDGQYHKAVSYLLAANKVLQAIDLFRRHRLFKEAVSLASLRLSPSDSMLEDIYTEWGQNLMKEGQFEQAAKCYLAARHIQETCRAHFAHLDQLYLKTASYTKLSTNENQQGLTYAYTVCKQHLVLAEWQEAYTFIEKDQNNKILLPLLSTHELLTQQLIALNLMLTLTHKPVIPEMCSVWDFKDVRSSKAGFPEFLMDKSEIDPVVPWEPFLIKEHTFPHYLLRVWHQHLNVTMVTEELRTMHASLSKLASQRQNTSELPNILVLVSMDMTLCLLSLLMSETSRAITHFLQAMSTLHQNNQGQLLQALCRLMLPQGPKYMLKLQQEFNASRVLVNMESYGDVNKAGGENHNSIKKFLTDIKDDGAISMSSLRCRELDCLRAYYYLAVLDFLRDSLPSSQYENDSHDGMPNRKIVSCGENTKEASVNTNLRGRDSSKNTIDHESEKGINKGNKTVLNQGSSKVNITTAESDIQDSNGDSIALSAFRNSQICFPESSSALPQSSPQILGGNCNSYPVICAPKNKDIDKNIVSDVTSDIFIPHNDALSNKSLVQSHEHMPSLVVSPSVLPKTSLKSSLTNVLHMPSKLQLLNISPLRRAASGSKILQAKSFSTSPSNLPSSLSWSSNPPHLQCPSLHSQSCTSLQSASQSSNTWQSLSLLSQFSSSNSISASTLSPSPLKKAPDSSTKNSECVSKLNKLSPDMRRSQTHCISNIHLNYGNLLRLSKGILWDIQAKREALTETLGYIHYAISQHLLNTSTKGNIQCDQVFSNTSPKKQSMNNRQSNLHFTKNNDLEEDGGYNNKEHMTTWMPLKSQAASDSLRQNSSNAVNESSRTKFFSSSNVEHTRLSILQPTAQTEYALQNYPEKNSSGSYSYNTKSSHQSSRQQHTIDFKAEQDLYNPLSNEPAAVHKSRKVLWMDGEETCANVCSENHISAFNLSRQAPDGSDIPVDWYDLPVDVKYSMPYVSLTLLKQEQENISRELRRVPDMPKIPFPSTTVCVRALLHTSLMSPQLSAVDRQSYIKQLNDWATLFSITTHQQEETEELFSTAAVEYLADRN